MKHTKRELIPLYSYYDRSGIAAHLADMAAQGWMLDKLSGWCWRYRRAEPAVRRHLLPRRLSVRPRPLRGAGDLPGLLRRSGVAIGGGHRADADFLP